MRTFKRGIAGTAVVVATILSAPVAIAAPADVDRNGIVNGYISDCNGELVSIEGTYHEVIRTGADGSRSGHVAIRATGIGDQGNVYVVNENTSDKIGGDGSETVLNQFRMISKGSAPNFLASIKFTISAAGDFNLLSSRSICPG
jgi:hypothetical protein